MGYIIKISEQFPVSEQAQMHAVDESEPITLGLDKFGVMAINLYVTDAIAEIYSTGPSEFEIKALTSGITVNSETFLGLKIPGQLCELSTAQIVKANTITEINFNYRQIVIVKISRQFNLTTKN
jgi:hypothetical protein